MSSLRSGRWPCPMMMLLLVIEAMSCNSDSSPVRGVCKHPGWRRSPGSVTSGCRGAPWRAVKPWLRFCCVRERQRGSRKLLCTSSMASVCAFVVHNNSCFPCLSSSTCMLIGGSVSARAGGVVYQIPAEQWEKLTESCAWMLPGYASTVMDVRQRLWVHALPR